MLTPEVGGLVPVSGSRVGCPRCGGIVVVEATAYGSRAVCFEPCNVRWTHIRGEKRWTAERR